jgi:hypothetical protein
MPLRDRMPDQRAQAGSTMGHPTDTLDAMGSANAGDYRALCDATAPGRRPSLYSSFPPAGGWSSLAYSAVAY